MVHAHRAVKLGASRALLQNGEAMAELKSQETKFSEDKARLEARLSEVEKQLLDKTNEVSLLKRSVSQLETKLRTQQVKSETSLKKSVTRANREAFRAQQALSEVSRLKAHLATQDVVNQDLKATLNVVKREAKESQKNSERLNHEMQEILVCRDESAKHLRSLEARLSRSQMLVSSLRGEAAIFADGASKREASLQNKIKELKEKNINLECELFELQGELFDH
jgi:chromosome segregation ATPase